MLTDTFSKYFECPGHNENQGGSARQPGNLFCILGLITIQAAGIISTTDGVMLKDLGFEILRSHEF